MLFETSQRYAYELLHRSCLDSKITGYKSCVDRTLLKRIMDNKTRKFLNTVSRPGGELDETLEVISVADNCRFDERLMPQRWTQFEAEAARNETGELAVWADWMEMETRYRQREVEVSRFSVPATFLPCNEDAWLDNLAEQQTVMRLESVSWPLKLSACSQSQLEAWWGARSQSGEAGNCARVALTKFLNVWNAQRDHRPIFGTFLDAVQEDADNADWPHRLRDVLGLGHYGRTSEDGPVVVMQMRYPLSEAISAAKGRKWAASVALPTPLDGGMNEFFFPSPAGHPYGSTLHLKPSCAGQLAPEILHASFDYKISHIHAIGIICRPHPMEGEVLSSSRDEHLVALRHLSERPNFGELQAGRTAEDLV